MNGDQHLVEMTGVIQAAWVCSQVTSIGRPKPPLPLANRFVRHRDAPVGKSFFGLSNTEAEPMVQPGGATDVRGWNMKAIGSWACLVFMASVG